MKGPLQGLRELALAWLLLGYAMALEEDANVLDAREKPFWGIMDHIHNFNSMGNWYLDRYLQEGRMERDRPTQIHTEYDSSLLDEYLKRKAHRKGIRMMEGWPEEPVAADVAKPLAKRDIKYIEDSVPLQLSLSYGETLAYELVSNADSKWANGYESLVFISAAMCRLPSDWNTEQAYNGLTIYYTYNETLATNEDYISMEKAQFQNGFAEALAEVDAYDDTTAQNLYMFIVPDTCDNCTEATQWEFELGASGRNILFRYDVEPVISVVDVDYEGGLFDASGVTFNVNSTYELYVFNSTSSPLSVGMNQSWCAIREVAQSEAFSTMVELNSTSVSNTSRVVPVTGLEKDTPYDAVLVMNDDTVEYGGGVYQAFTFRTAHSEACKLLYNLEFCDMISYAVPNSRNFTLGDVSWADVAEQYDNNAKSYYEGFEFALQQTACDTELSARYSPLRTCSNCDYSYRLWLCGVTIPRCSVADGAATRAWEAGEGRTDFVADTIEPPLAYAEILPCLNTCWAIVRDCPADFQFGCPKRSEYIEGSYVDPHGNTTLECNYMGNQGSLLASYHEHTSS